MSLPETPCSFQSVETSFLGETRIRRAVPRDAARIAELAAAAYRRYLDRLDKKPAPMTEDYPKRVAEGSVFVLEILPAGSSGSITGPGPRDSGAVAPRVEGFIVLVPVTEAMLLDNVAVDPAAQGRGHGKKLMAFAEERARRAGFRRIILYTNEVMTENLRLYPRLGYAETHRVSEKGFNRIYFSKAIA